MPYIHLPPAVPGSLPDHYQEVLYWRLSEKKLQFIALQILALFPTVVFGGIFWGLAVTVGRLSAIGKFGLIEIGWMCISSSLLVVIVHELAHGQAMRIFGATPQYGFMWKLMIFYATSPGFAYRRNHYVWVALAPLVGISGLVVVGMWLLSGTLWVILLGLCGVLNAGGAIGDMWMTGIVLRYPPNAYVVDERDGIRVFLSKG